MSAHTCGLDVPTSCQMCEDSRIARLRIQFEDSVKANKGKHGMLCDLSRHTTGEYRSACERSAWWAWQEATKGEECL